MSKNYLNKIVNMAQNYNVLSPDSNASLNFSNVGFISYDISNDLQIKIQT